MSESPQAPPAHPGTAIQPRSLHQETIDWYINKFPAARPAIKETPACASCIATRPACGGCTPVTDADTEQARNIRYEAYTMLQQIRQAQQGVIRQAIREA